MDVRGPMSIFFCWEALVLAVLVSTFTSLLKVGMDLKFGGKDERAKKHPWLSLIVLPLVPITLGVFGAFVLRPHEVDVYISWAHGKGQMQHSWAVVSFWGAAVGQLSDYLYQRVRSVIETRETVKAARS